MYKRQLDDYTISPAQLESDLAAFKKAGWEPVSLSDIFDYVYADGELPQKPVLLVFDDGYKSFLTFVLPILEKYQAPAVAVSYTHLDVYKRQWTLQW